MIYFRKADYQRVFFISFCVAVLLCFTAIGTQKAFAEIERINLEPCASHRDWCYNGGGNLSFEHGYIEVIKEDACRMRLVIQGASGSTQLEPGPPYRLQMFYQTNHGSGLLGMPFTTDSAGSFNGIIGKCPKGQLLGVVISSSGRDESFGTHDAGARQQFATRDYCKNAQPTSGAAPPTQNTKAASTGVLVGLWKLKYIGGGDTIDEFSVFLKQVENHFFGPMVLTKGEGVRKTKVEGEIRPDGTLNFVRSKGSWQEFYVGRVVKYLGERAIRLEGEFGDKGDENMRWYAVRGLR